MRLLCAKRVERTPSSSHRQHQQLSIPRLYDPYIHPHNDAVVVVAYIHYSLVHIVSVASSSLRPAFQDAAREICPPNDPSTHTHTRYAHAHACRPVLMLVVMPVGGATGRLQWATAAASRPRNFRNNMWLVACRLSHAAGRYDDTCQLRSAVQFI